MSLCFVRNSAHLCPSNINNVHKKVKVKAFNLTLVVPSVTMLVPMETDGAPFTPLPPSVPRFSGIKAMATQIRGKSKQTLKLQSIKPGTSCSESQPTEPRLPNDWLLMSTDLKKIIWRKADLRFQGYFAASCFPYSLSNCFLSLFRFLAIRFFRVNCSKAIKDDTEKIQRSIICSDLIQLQ